MKEYCIYTRHGDGRPFRLKYYNTYVEALRALYNMISYEEERQKPYYVDNDFYSNSYNMATKLTYYRLEVREVTEWKKYSKEDTTIIKNDSNIIFLENFI